MISKRKIYFLMVMASVFWAGAFVAGKFSVPFIPPFSLTFLRFLPATLIMFFLRKRFDKEKTYKLNRKDLPVFLFTGIVGMVFYHIFFFSALQYTSAINSSIIAATNPIITVVIGYFFAKEHVSKVMGAGILISFLGVLLTITKGNFEIIKTLDFNLGDILMLVAVVSWAAYSVFSKKIGGRFSPMTLIYYSFLICTIVSFPLTLLDKPWQWIGGVPLIALLAVLYMSIFASVAGYLIQQISIKEIGAGRTSIFINLVPIFSIILSILILGEKLELIKVVAAAIIVMGVYICQVGGKKTL